MDKGKEKISYLKLWLTFLFTSNAATMAWLFRNIHQISLFNKVFIIVVILVLTISLVFIHHKTYRIIKTLGD
jgi:hypothetical protein